MIAKLSNDPWRRLSWLALLALIAVVLLTPAAAQAQDRQDRRRQDAPARGQRVDQRLRTPRQGERVRALPPTHVVVNVNRSRYYYGRGAFYRPYQSGYVVVRAPIGARVRSLPYGYFSFSLSSGRYFYGAGNYYLWEPLRSEYVVVDAPQGAPAPTQAAASEASTELFAYPKQGQSEEQTDRDRYECHLWAVQQSGFDPSEPGERVAMIPDYRRAMTACLEGRGYSVR